MKMKTPIGSAGVRHAALKAWLEKHNARCHNEGKYGNADLEGYIINGRVVYVLHQPEGNGWDLLVPASQENSITAALQAAERACGIRCTCGEGDDPCLAHCEGCALREFIPDAAHINALPEPIRQYIHDLETRCDPAGDVQTIACLRQRVAALTIRCESSRIREAYSHLGAALMQTHPNDDAIIIGHVRDAHKIMERAILGAPKEFDNWGPPRPKSSADPDASTNCPQCGAPRAMFGCYEACGHPDTVLGTEPAKPLKVIVASLEGAKFDVYRTHVNRWVMDFSKSASGEWRYQTTFTIPSYGVVDSRVYEGINPSDVQAIRTAIQEVQRGG